MCSSDLGVHGRTERHVLRVLGQALTLAVLARPGSLFCASRAFRLPKTQGDAIYSCIEQFGATFLEYRWWLDGRPLLGISVFAVLDMPLEKLLRQRFANFRSIYLPTVGRLARYGFDLLPTGQRPHFTVRLRHASDEELDRLLAALGDVQSNPEYALSRDLT